MSPFVFNSFVSLCVEGEMMAPPLPDVPLPSPGIEPTTLAAPAPALAPLGKEKKNGAKKKCLYNFQDAFLEAKQVVMATSAATSSVSCTATTVQSSNNFLEVASKRPTSLGKGGELETGRAFAKGSH